MIFRIHLDKPGQRPDDFYLPHLAELSAGYSGAEIEQTVVGALYSAAALEADLSTETLQRAIAETNPLSVVMFEKIESLRHWAQERCVFAN